MIFKLSGPGRGRTLIKGPVESLDINTTVPISDDNCLDLKKIFVSKSASNIHILICNLLYVGNCKANSIKNKFLKHV